MTTTRNPVDYSQVSIKQELDQFNQCYNALCEYDFRSEALVGILGCTWFFGSLGTVSALFIATAFLGASSFNNRPQLAKQYQDQLNKLFEIYTWCLATSGKSITSDKNFRELTKAILPFIEYEDLKKPLHDWKDVSIEFALIFVKDSMHRTKLLSDIKATPSTWFDYFSSDRKQRTESILKAGSALEGNSVTHRSQSAYANARFLLYSRSKEQAQPITERASQLLDPIRILMNR